jgi:hypothetical protein
MGKGRKGRTAGNRWSIYQSIEAEDNNFVVEKTNGEGFHYHKHDPTHQAAV